MNAPIRIVIGLLINRKNKGEAKMEKYFIVTEKARLHKDWFEYIENRKIVNDLFKKFAQENGIEATQYYVTDDSIHIVPTGIDVESFGNILGAVGNEGLRKFKFSSKISKSWKKALKDAGVKVLHKPMVILYFESMSGRFRSRIFDQDGVLYCSIEPAGENVPDGFEQIKASEFFKVIEESDRVTA